MKTMAIVLAYIGMLQFFCLYQEAEGFVPWKSPKFAEHLSFKETPELSKFEKRSKHTDDIKLMCYLFVRYNDMLNTNIVMNSSQRRSLTSKYYVIMNTLKNFVNEDPNNAKFIYEAMQEAKDIDESNVDPLDMNGKLPFKWGR